MKEKGIEPAMVLAMERGSTDATAQVLKIKSAGADFVLGCLYEAELAILLRDAHKYGVNVPVIGALGADFESTLKRVNNPAAVKSFYLPYQFKAPIGSPEMKKWEAIFVKYLEKSELPENGVPTNFYYFGVPTAIATVEAFKRVGPNPTREKFYAALESFKDWDTGVLADKVTLSKDNHVGVHDMYAVGLNEQGKEQVYTAWGKPLQ
jgi:branched-chain amino acid transport system substrate-binding protein